MLRVDDNVVNLIEKVRRAIKNGAMTAERFPMDELYNLIECTLGSSFWDCIGSERNYGFQEMPPVYKECLQDALNRMDMEGCNRILQMFEYTYLALYTAMSEDEKIFRQRPYRKMIIELGEANARLQYRLHQARQANLSKEDIQLAEGKGVVYTCVLGEKNLIQPAEVSAKLDYLCFTDQKEKWGKKEGVWKYCAIDNTEEWDDNLLESKYKILGCKLLQEYDYSIWISPDIIITGDVLRFCKIYGGGNSFLSFSQNVEDCIYDDISVTHIGADDLNVEIRKKILHYQKEGYPKHNGLIDSRVIIRNHRSEKMLLVMEKWWEETKECQAFRGNIFNYVAWKDKFPFSICDLFLYQNPYFRNSEIDLNTNEDY